MPDPVEQVIELVAKIRPILAGNPPWIVGAVLADLLSIFLAGHREPMREGLIEEHLKTVRGLIPINEAEIRGRRN